MTLSAGCLERIGIEAGAKYGYDAVNVEYLSLPEVTIRWRGDTRGLSIILSDYLGDADATLVEALVDAVMMHLVSGDALVLPRSLYAYLQTPQFVGMWRPVYLRRAELQNEINGRRNTVPAWIRVMAAQHGVTPVICEGTKIQASKIFNVVKIPHNLDDEKDRSAVRLAIMEAAMEVSA